MNATLAGFISAIALLSVFQAPAWAANCGDKASAGGTNVVCNCGDTVTTNTKLVTNPADPNFDPVISTGAGDVCPGHGLFITSSNVFLSLRGGTIRGGGGVGIGLIGALTNVTVEKGTIEGFGFAVSVFSASDSVSNSKIQKIRARQNASGNGIEGHGSNHIFSFNESKLNGGSGIAVLGSGHNFTYNSTSSNRENGLIAPEPGNFDQGHNTGVANAEGVQCAISGVACQ